MNVLGAVLEVGQSCLYFNFPRVWGLVSLLKVPSFYPFFYENLKNSTFNDLLHKILNNKVALKKIQHKEAVMGIN